MPETIRARVIVAVVTWLASAGSLGAQAPAVDVTYGTWMADSPALLWSAGYRRAFMGPIDYSISLTHLDDHRSSFNRTQTGAEISVGLWRDGSGPYGVVGTGLGMKHYDGNIDASWSAGAGWALRVLPFVSIGLEMAYRAEDQFSRGFWRLDPTDRRGFAVLARARMGGGARRSSRPPQPAFEPPSLGTVRPAARVDGFSPSGSELAADVVETALQVMGTPYRWGGDGSNGYDCSGLIQYAYGQHGVILPRVSREQARQGIAVARQIESLQAGDILGFSIEGDRVTHVGLYIGEGQFIHSASAGVKLSSLTAGDPDSVWWQRRWVQSRRILQ